MAPVKLQPGKVTLEREVTLAGKATLASPARETKSPAQPIKRGTLAKLAGSPRVCSHAASYWGLPRDFSAAKRRCTSRKVGSRLETRSK